MFKLQGKALNSKEILHLRLHVNFKSLPLGIYIHDTFLDPISTCWWVGGFVCVLVLVLVFWFLANSGKYLFFHSNGWF